VARAEKLDRAAQDWLKDVHLLILPQEEKTFRDLRDPADRAEFQAIFWARRDPDPGTPANEFRNAWEKARERADKLFAVPGERGSQTGCGQVFLLLGDPREAAGRKTEVYSTHFHDTKQGETHGIGETTYRSLKEGTRPPESWIYRSRPGDAFEFTGGELHIDMDEACRFPEGGHVLDELRRAAQARMVRPELDYRIGPDGHLVRLAALVAHVPAAPALAEDKKDFPLEAEVKLLLRSQSGEPYVAGLLRGQPGPTAAAGAAPSGQARIRIVAQALEADGRVFATTDRLVSVGCGPDGSFVASFGLTLKPGHYTLRAGAFPSGDTRSAVASAPLDVPDFAARELTLGRLLVYTSADPPGTDPADPYGAFSVVRVRPRFGNVFARKDEIEAACVLYNAGIDPAGKAALKVRFSFLKDGKPVARGQEDNYTTKDAVASLGPVPLSGFAPGRYAVRIDVTDAVAGTTRTQEAPFEIRD
jgi:GWxTD domain-containing protein